MISHSECDPVLTEVGAKAEDGMSRLDEGIKNPKLSLEMRGIAQDVEIVLWLEILHGLGSYGWTWDTHPVELEGLGVGFQSLFVVFLALLDEAKDVPAYMRGEIETHALLDEVDALVSAAHVGEDEPLHADGFWRSW